MSDNKRFQDNGDGSITDTLTGLTWMKNDSYQDLKKYFTFRAATRYAEAKNQEAFAGFTDWRVPDKKEALSLYVTDKSQVVKDRYDMDVYIDPVFPPGGGYNTWTSETRGRITAFIFSFGDGTGAHQEVDGTVDTSIRLVRGQSDPEAMARFGKVHAPRTMTRGGGWR